jgi:hypothetical protein
MENKVTYCREVSKPVSAGFCLFVWLVGFLFVCLFLAVLGFGFENSCLLGRHCTT